MDDGKIQPDLRNARQTAVTAHSVVIKLKEMGLPEDYDGELALLSTDLGDLWSAQRELVALLDGLVGSPHDWGAVGDSLVDLRATVDHIRWHVDSVREPMTRLTEYAYNRAEHGAAGQ